MKITRLKSGFRLHLTDGEWEAMMHLIELGRGDVESDWDGQTESLSYAARRAISGRLARFDGLATDVDRRGRKRD